MKYHVHFIFQGLVTYREEYLLYNEELATTRQRENILTIIAHEYAVSSRKVKFFQALFLIILFQ